MSLTLLTYIGLNISILIDRGYQITVDNIKNLLQEKELFIFLKKEYNNFIDLSLLNEIDSNNIEKEWHDFALSINEKRKFGIEKNGFCLINSYIYESIQRRKLYENV